MASYMKVLMTTIPRQHPEIEVLEVNTDKDHIHLLVSIAPKMAIAEAVRILKSNTGRMMVKVSIHPTGLPRRNDPLVGRLLCEHCRRQ